MGTGGSRFGSGRPGWRRKCEHLLALDVRVLARRGRLTPRNVVLLGMVTWGRACGKDAHPDWYRPRSSDLHLHALRLRSTSMRLLSADRPHALSLRRLSPLVPVPALLVASGCDLRRS